MMLARGKDVWGINHFRSPFINQLAVCEIQKFKPRIGLILDCNANMLFRLPEVRGTDLEHHCVRGGFECVKLVSFPIALAGHTGLSHHPLLTSVCKHGKLIERVVIYELPLHFLRPDGALDTTIWRICIDRYLEFDP
jgi:hypothetical protein